ncbi:MAG: FAD-binding oxidoreductase [Chloroflexi bacterium]|nr:FAD-binding oxidoreductase [Chloroflexota bacterium]
MGEDIAAALRQALGEGAVLDDLRTRQLHAADALSPSRAFSVAPASWNVPLLVVMPDSTEAVARVVRLACQYRAPVIPFGGGTGVMGAAVPCAGSIVVDLKRLNRVRAVSREDGTALVEAGAILKDLDAALQGHGLMLGHDPWSLPIATVGGAISTNGVGYRAARYGSMGAQVLGLEVVLPTGDVVVTSAAPKAASGPNLNGLFIGAEGTLGIITAATLRVFRAPEERRFATVAFATFEDGFRAVAELSALGMRPAILDLTEERRAPRAAPGVLLYLAFEGYREEVEAQEKRSLRLCREFAGQELGPQQTEAHWRERHLSGERYQQQVLPLLPEERWARGSDRRQAWDYLHVALPVSRVLKFRQQAAAIAKEAGATVQEYSVWTAPELFSLLMTGAAVEGPGDSGAFAHAVDAILRLAQDLGGSMEYCHGVGLKLAHLVEREWGSGLDVVRRLKRVLDPYGIMNPGKLGL